MFYIQSSAHPSQAQSHTISAVACHLNLQSSLGTLGRAVTSNSPVGAHATYKEYPITAEDFELVSSLISL